MEAPRGAREPTGTNGPTLNNNPHHACGCNKSSEQSTAATTIRTTINPHPPRKQTVGDSVEHQSCGGHSTGETPSNIPNLEAKPGSADGTATDRLWESRTPPQHTQTGAARNRKVSGRSLYSHTRTQTQRTHTHPPTIRPAHTIQHARPPQFYIQLYVG